MNKRIISLLLALVMFMGIVPLTYAAPLTDAEIVAAVNGALDGDPVGVYTDIKIKTGQDLSYGNGPITKSLADAKATTFDYRADMSMTNVRNSMDLFVTAAAMLGISATDLNNAYVADGQFDITIKYPTSGFVIPAEFLNSKNLYGFTSSKGDAALREVFEETEQRVTSVPGQVTVKIKVKGGPGLTVNNLKEKLGDLFLECQGVQISNTGTYKVVGEVVGWTDIEYYKPQRARVEYNFAQGNANVLSVDDNLTDGIEPPSMDMAKDPMAESNEISATVVVTDSQGGAGISQKYTVTVIFGDNLENKKYEYTKGANVDLNNIKIPENEGYDFAGFYYDKEFTSPAQMQFKINEDITVYAKWEEKDDLCDLNVVIADNIDNVEFEYAIGSTVIIDEIKLPTRPGYIFDGYFYDAECTKPVEEDFVISEDMHIYTKWIKAELSASVEKDNHFAYIIGYPTKDGSDIVRPDASITREEIATVFYRIVTEAHRDEIYKDTNEFTDVEPSRWSNIEISSIANAGYVEGYEDGSFKPSDTITRAEFVTIAARLFDVKMDSLVENSELTDIDNHWAKAYINFAVREGWLAGYEDSTFRPDRDITRAEVMKIINNILGRHINEEGLIEDAIRWDDNSADAWYYYTVIEATNSHNYDRAEGVELETWTELTPNRDWANDK